MSTSAYYHIGIVVDHLDNAIASYKKSLDIEFTEVAETSLYIENTNTQTATNTMLRVIYSRKNSPYIELIEATGDGVFSQANTNELLYFGIWEHDIERRLTILQQQGIGINATIYPEKGKPASAIITAPDELGVRREYVDSAIRGYTTAWAQTGKLPANSVLSKLLTDIYTLFFSVCQWFTK